MKEIDLLKHSGEFSMHSDFLRKPIIYLLSILTSGVIITCKIFRSNKWKYHLILVPNKNEENPEGDFGIRESKLNLSDNIKYTYSGLSCIKLNSLKSLTVHYNKLGQLYRDWAINEFLSGEVYYGNWIDVGTHERLKKARNLVKNQI